MDAFLFVIGIMSGVSLLLMLYNALRTQLPTPSLSLRTGENRLTLWIEGRRYVGVAYNASELPSLAKQPGRRIYRIARDIGVSVTVISGLYRVPRDTILRKIEDAYSKIEASYTLTRSARLKKQMELIESLIEEIAANHTPYWGSLNIIVWVPEGVEGLAKAEAVKTLLEADLGVKLERVEVDVGRLLAPTPGKRPLGEGAPVIIPSIESRGGYPVVLGWRVGSSEELVYLSYPKDFETHIGVVGPTGKGKTVLLAGIASQLAFRAAAESDLEVSLIDPKGDLVRLTAEFEGPGFTVLSGPGEGAAHAVRRLRELWERHRGLGGPRRVVVIVDEAWRLMGLEPTLFEAIAREGRSLGFHLVYAVQEPDDIPRPVVDNTGILLVFGGSTLKYAQDAELLGLQGLGDEIANLPVGEAVLLRRSSEPLIVRTLHFGKLLKPARRPALRQARVGTVGEEAAPAENG
jgi:hypothetical protein